jgi:farnesyl diphosphate synthase
VGGTVIGQKGDAVTDCLNADALFEARLHAAAVDTETTLDRLLAPHAGAGEVSRPARLLEAMRYATLGGGKRLRPFVLLESAALFGVPRQRALMAGAALECAHCYSLVHDDLPAMDNDALRRGRPTVHAAYDDATAILVGDGLLTFSFDILSRPETHPDAAVRIALTSAMARAAGVGGMVGGQMLDLAAEGRFADGRPQPLAEAEIAELQTMKTGALLRFACLAGAILGSARPPELEALHRYGSALGQAFQIADDLLDVEGSTATLGKSAGKDAAAGKATLVGVLGVAKARARLERLIGEALAALEPFAARAAMLKSAARFIAERRN